MPWRLQARLCGILLLLAALETRADASTLMPQAADDCGDAQAEMLLRHNENTAVTELYIANAGDPGPRKLPLQAAMVQALHALNSEENTLVQYGTKLLDAARGARRNTCVSRALWLMAAATEQRERAEELLDQATAALGVPGAHTALAARLLRTRGQVLRAGGNYQASGAAHEAALAIWQEQGDRWGVAGEQINLSLIASQLGEIGRAIDLGTQARRTMEEAGDASGQAKADESLAAAYLEVHQYDLAEAHLRSALDLHQTLGDFPGMSFDYTSLARLAVVTGRDFEARQFIALAKASTLPRHWAARAYALDTQSALDLLGGKNDDARAAAGQCLEQAKAHGHLDLEAFCEAGLAEALVDHDPSAALAPGLRSLLLAEQLQSPSQVALAAAALQRTLQLLGRRDEAIFFGKLAVGSLHALRLRVGDQPLQFQRALLEGHRWIHVRLADLLIETGRLAEAQQVMALMKRQELFDYLRGERADSGGRELDYSTRENGWLGSYRELAGRLLSAPGAAAEAAFLKFAGALPATTRAPPRPASPPSSGHRWRSRLATAGDGVVLLQYLVADDHLRVLLTSHRGQRVYTLPGTSAEVAESVSRLLQALGNPEADARDAATQAWRQWLAPLQPELDRLHARTLWLSLDGPLRYVPFAALHDGQQWLAQRYDNMVLSEALGAPPAARRPRTAPRVAGFGVSRADRDFEALPYVPRELAAIVRSVNQAQAGTGVLPGRIYLDDEFSRSALSESFRDAYPLVHIATHFRLMPGSDADSFLLLGDHSHLSVRDFRKSPDRLQGVELLTLSACQTAVSANGNELEGFAAVAQLKGARHVMASLWPISDAGTEILMRDFYTHLSAKRLDSAAALAAAQRSMLALAQRSDNAVLRRLEHPYFWAAFIVLGAPR